MNEEDDGEKVIPGKGFNEQSAWKRFLILLNGSAFNILLAVVLMALYLYGNGILDMDSTKIGEIMPGFPSEIAGLRVGDEIQKVNGESVTRWREMSEKIRTEAAKNESVSLTVKRGGETLALTVNIPNNEEYGRPMLGVSPSYVRYGIFMAFRNSAGYIYRMTLMMLRGLAELVMGYQEADVTGPVGIGLMGLHFLHINHRSQSRNPESFSHSCA